MRSVIRFVAMMAVGVLGACGSIAQPGTGVATNPPPGTQHAAAPASNPLASGIRTVLAPLGLNVRDSPSTSGSVAGTAAQATVLTVLGTTTDSGGAQWYKVQGASTVGWISGDPSLSSPNRFLLFPSDRHDFSALYLDTWTFAEQGNVVFFRPQSAGTETIAVTLAASDAALGPAGRPGYQVTTFDTTEVCGVTTTLRHFDRIGASPTAAATPVASAAPVPNGIDMAPALAHLSEIRIPVDATHVLAVDFVYDSDAQVADFTDFANSLAFPAPQCIGGTPGAAPAASPA